MCRSASPFLLQRLKGSMSGDARDFNNMETRVVIKFFFLQGKEPKEIRAILRETLGEHSPSYATVKNWVTQFKLDDFSTCDTPRPGRPKTVTTPDIIHQIHKLILEDAGFRLNQQLSNWASYVSWLDPSFLKIWTCGSSPQSGSRNAWTWIKNVIGAIRLSNFRNSFGAIQMISFRDWWRNLVISLWTGDKATINGVAA